MSGTLCYIARWTLKDSRETKALLGLAQAELQELAGSIGAIQLNRDP